MKLLVQILSDGKFHSGTELGEKFNLTRSAIWKFVKQLEQYGIEVEAKTKRGYRIIGGLELLDKKSIEKYIEVNYRHYFKNSIIIDTLASTNSYLVELAKDKKNKVSICFAENQTAGRGRMGRHWISPYGRNIYLSLLWRSRQDLYQLNGLSIAIVIAVIEALKAYGIKKKLMLKWPNDVLWKQCKLAGILIDLFGESHNVYNVIIGVGVNVNMPIKAGHQIKQPWCDLAQITHSMPSRNKLAGILLSQILKALEIYQVRGLSAFSSQWKQLDICYNKPVKIITPTEVIAGIGRGIDNQGHFLLQKANGEIKTFAVGEVSLQF